MAVVVLVLGYLLGSLPTGLLVVRALTGQDIRAIGSGNIGTVNVYRVAGLPAAVLVLDMATDLLPGGGEKAMGEGAAEFGKRCRWIKVKDFAKDLKGKAIDYFRQAIGKDPNYAVQRGEGDRHIIWGAARHLPSGGFGRCRGVGHRRGRYAVRVAGLLARHDFRSGDDVVAQGAAGVSRIWTYHPDVCGVPSSREFGQADLRDRTPGDRQTGGIMTVHAVRRA